MTESDFEITPLGKQNRTDFSCGQDALDRYLMIHKLHRGLGIPLESLVLGEAPPDAQATSAYITLDELNL